jgi:uncharacterized protein
MILCDVNILLYAFREDSPSHSPVKEWLDAEINSDRAFGVSDLVLSGFLRIATHPRIFDPPTPMQEALSFAEQLRQQPHAVRIEPGQHHWGIFTRLCREAGTKGNLVPDAWFAALAIESGCEWITTDRDYARFPQLRWSSPLG